MFGVKSLRFLFFFRPHTQPPQPTTINLIQFEFSLNLWFELVVQIYGLLIKQRCFIQIIDKTVNLSHEFKLN